MVQLNLNPIYADIAFKLAEPFTALGQWNLTSVLYARAQDLAPQQDYYDLFQGRSLLEQAKKASTPAERTSLVMRAEENLITAQKLNPLNPDHTANLARLQSWWAAVTNDPQERSQRMKAAASYYAQAVTLSPNSPTLWAEWASIYWELDYQPEEAWKRLEKALDLDDRYHMPRGLAGEFYLNQARAEQDPLIRQDAFNQAINYYRAAADLSSGGMKARYLVSLSNVFIELSGLAGGSAPGEAVVHDPTRLSQAIAILQEALQAKPPEQDMASIQGQVAQLFYQLGDKTNALNYVESALSLATENQRSYLQELLANIQKLP